MPVDIIGYVPHTRATDTSGLWWSDEFDLAYIEETALAHEEAGFDRVLVGFGSWSPDSWLIAAHVLRVTKNLKVLIAHRPGFVQPTVAARQAITLDRLSGGGRIGLHIITGGTGIELRRDGDTLPESERYPRTAEYIDVMRKVWESDKPFDHNGHYYHAEQAFSSVRPLATPLVSFGGASEGALAAGPGRADLYLINGEPLAQTAETAGTIQRLAQERGRSISLGVTLRAVIGNTEDEAWAKADAIYRKAAEDIAKARQAPEELLQANATTNSVGAQRLDAIAHAGDVQDERLWLGFTRLLGRGGSTSALVGTGEQVTEAFLHYYDLGINTLYLRGWEIAADARAYGRDWIPLLREAVARRDA